MILRSDPKQAESNYHQLRDDSCAPATKQRRRTKKWRSKLDVAAKMCRTSHDIVSDWLDVAAKMCRTSHDIV